MKILVLAAFYLIEGRFLAAFFYFQQVTGIFDRNSVHKHQFFVHKHQFWLHKHQFWLHKHQFLVFKDTIFVSSVIYVGGQLLLNYFCSRQN